MNADTNGRLPAPLPAHPRGERKLEQWLRRSLSDAHDEVLTQGLPPAWIAMIDKKLPPA